MTDHPVSILIANYDGREALELCVESVLARTASNEPVHIIVYDSPASGHDRPYLERMADDGKLTLIAGTEDMMHGPAVWRLLSERMSEWVVIIDSDCEIRDRTWLRFMFSCVEDEASDIGVSKLRQGGALFKGELLTPYYWLACMLLNAEQYFTHGGRLIDWPEQYMPYADYRGPFDFKRHMTEGVTTQAWHVGIDTGGIFTERLLSGDMQDCRMRELPPLFWDRYVRHYGGISRNHHRPEHPEIAPRWVEIKRRLVELRATA
ncbi:MAG: glycosyltransferase family 2 protein [Chloroflexi bacterium]|nr:glycosyltransferase family 2 protein [Chloroflexota bacterium]